MKLLTKINEILRPKAKQMQKHPNRNCRNKEAFETDHHVFWQISMRMAIPLPKMEPSFLSTAMVCCPLFPAIVKTCNAQYHKWRRHIGHYHFNCQVLLISPEKSPTPMLCNLSSLRCRGRNLLLSSYWHWITCKNSSLSTCRHPPQDFNHLLRDCPTSEPLS